MGARKKASGSGAAESRPLAVRYRVTWPHGVNLRGGPGIAGPVLRVLPRGEIVTREGGAELVQGGIWLPVQGGWVCAAYLEPLPEEA